MLFFDDYPLETENQIFLLDLRALIRGRDIEVEEVRTIPHLENQLQERQYLVIILDVMAAMENGLEALAGIEILRRCRNGHYGDLNRDVPIYLRTARGETHVRETAVDFGCTGYYKAGSHDDRLLEELGRLLGA